MMNDSASAPTALHQAVLGPHRTIEALAVPAHEMRESTTEPRLTWRDTDTFLSVISRHLAAVEEGLLPTARATLGDGHHRVTGYLHDARALELSLHMMKARMYGDVHVSGMTRNEVWERIDRQLDTHERLEEELVDDLVDGLGEQQVVALAQRVNAALDHAPTRPHPYTPHSGRLGRVAHHLWRVVDRFWDTAEGRVIPHKEKPPHPRRGSKMTRYVLGAPSFEGKTDTPDGDSTTV